MKNQLKHLPNTANFIKSAKANRKDFLDPYKKRFDEAKKEIANLETQKKHLPKEIVTDSRGVVLGRSGITDDEKKLRAKILPLTRKRAEIIIELIQLEPSHLSESWILREVIKWLRDHNCKDYLERAFIQTGKRKPLTQKQLKKFSQRFHLANAIDQMVAKEGILHIQAFKKLALRCKNDNTPEQAELVIKKDYYRIKNELKERNVPYPYYGYDIQFHDGKLERIFAPLNQLPKLF